MRFCRFARKMLQILIAFLKVNTCLSPTGKPNNFYHKTYHMSIFLSITLPTINSFQPLQNNVSSV